MWCFRCKSFLKSDTVAGLTRIVSLKLFKILVCLRNFNYTIFVVSNLAPYTFTGCCGVLDRLIRVISSPVLVNTHTCVNLSRTSGTPPQQPVKVQGAKFKTTKISKLKFLKHTSILHHFKDTILFNPVWFQKGFTAKAPQTIMLGHHQATEKHSNFFQPKRGVPNSRNRDKINH